MAVRYEPADSLTPAEAGTLIDESADMRDITATVVDLAVRGFLRIEETEEKAFLGMITKRDYVFHRLTPSAGAMALEQHESRVLDGLFEGGGAVKLSDLDNEFYTNLPGIKDGIYDRLVGRATTAPAPTRSRAAG